MIDIEKIIDEKIINTKKKESFLYKKIYLPFLYFCLCKKKFDASKDLELFQLKGIDFVKAVLNYFNFKVHKNEKNFRNIPSKGRAIIVANHPIGSLDGLALLQEVYKVRKDVKIMANSWLEIITHIKELVLSVNNVEKNTLRTNIKKIYDLLESEGALIIFPAGEVSRFKFFKGIRDTDWNSGFVRFAKIVKAPIIPIYLKGRNSFWFYFLSYIHYNLSSLWLIREMMKQKNKSITMTVGEAIPFKSYEDNTKSTVAIAQLFKKHLYQIPKKKKTVFKTEQVIEKSKDFQIINDKLKKAEILLENDSDILYEYKTKKIKNDPIIDELGRCREISFRFVGEGTGKSRDIDQYDKNFYHIILWNKQDKRIIGSYRLGYAQELLGEKKKLNKLYSSSLYNISPQMLPLLKKGVELGRSFILPEYWKKGGLRKLLLGIDAWMKKHPHLQYLFGVISISNNYSPLAKDLIINFYLKHFPARDPALIKPKYIPYIVSQENQALGKELFLGDYESDLKILRERLSDLGYSIPSLFRNYSELFQEGGVEFYDFHVDADFSYSVDSFIIADTRLFAPRKSSPYFPYLSSQVKENTDNE